MNTTLGVVVTGIAGSAAAFLWYLGLFRSVRFAESFTQAALFLCVRRRGPYHNAGKALEDVCKFAEAHGLTTKSTKCAGLYFDDPKTVKAEELQWMAGLLVHRNEEQKCLAISQKDLAEHDMIIRVMPQTKVPLCGKARMPHAQILHSPLCPATHPVHTTYTLVHAWYAPSPHQHTGPVRQCCLVRTRYTPGTHRRTWYTRGRCWCTPGTHSLHIWYTLVSLCLLVQYRGSYGAGRMLGN